MAFYELEGHFKEQALQLTAKGKEFKVSTFKVTNLTTERDVANEEIERLKQVLQMKDASIIEIDEDGKVNYQQGSLESQLCTMREALEVAGRTIKAARQAGSEYKAFEMPL